MAKASPARKNKRLREQALFSRLGMTRKDVRESVNAAHLLNLYLDGRPE